MLLAARTRTERGSWHREPNGSRSDGTNHHTQWLYRSNNPIIAFPSSRVPFCFSVPRLTKIATEGSVRATGRRSDPFGAWERFPHRDHRFGSPGRRKPRRNTSRFVCRDEKIKKQRVVPARRGSFGSFLSAPKLYIYIYLSFISLSFLDCFAVLVASCYC